MTGAVLVTGAAGFIGSHLVERLLAEGTRVVGLDSFDDAYSPAIKQRNVCGTEAQGGHPLVSGDVRDADLLARLLSEHEVDRVVHLAARAGVRPSLEQPLLYQDVNVGGTLNLLEACRLHGVSQFVYASSSSVYGLIDQVPFREDMNVDRQASPYAASKAAAELFCRTYSELYGLPVQALRFFTVYGPRQRPEMAIHKFTRMIDDGEEITLFGGGESERDYTYVADIVDGISLALAYGGRGFGAFNLGGGRPVSLARLVQVIEEALGKGARIRHLPMQAGDVPRTFADLSKARDLLGYRPCVTIEEGIQRFVRWYRGSRAG